MHDITQEPHYGIPIPEAGGFLSKDNKIIAEQYTVYDLQRSGLTLEDMAIKPCLVHSAQYDAQYYIPYYDIDGHELVDQAGDIKMYRLRGELTAKGKADKLGKYQAPGRKTVGNLSTHPYLHPSMWDMECDVVCITEGEKKAAAVMKYAELPCVGIGGKDNWHESGNQRDLHPVLAAALEKRGPTEVWVIPDGDVRKNDIAQSFGSLYGALTEAGYTVRMLELPDDRDKVDDLIVGRWKGGDYQQLLRDLPDVESYVQSLQSLVQRYHLQFTARQNGGITVKANDYNITTLITHHPMFDELWYNEDDKRVYYGTDYVNDSVMSSLVATFQYRMSMADANYRVFARCLHQVARRERSKSPWGEYLEHLSWDGTERLETFFIDYCNAPDNALVREAGAKWMPSSVARALTPGCKVDYMVVTQGAQGIGKSMLPLVLWGNDKVAEILSHLHGKDLIMAMQSSFVASFEEMANMRGKDINELKGLVTAVEDTFRRPYAENEDTTPRRFILYGSVNDTTFLSADPSGYRRFVVVPMGTVALDRVRADRDQLWAEAVHSYKAGTDYGYIQGALADGAQYVVQCEESELLWETAVQDFLRLTDAEGKLGPSPSVGFTYHDHASGEDMYAVHITKLRMVGNLSGYTSQYVKQNFANMGFGYHKAKKIAGVLHKSLWVVPVSVLI